MRLTEQFSITLPRDMARIVKKKVASGTYASVSEVVREGVRTLAERDAAVEKWLRTDVIKSYKQYKANPDSGIPMKVAFARVRKNIQIMRKAQRLKKES